MAGQPHSPRELLRAAGRPSRRPSTELQAPPSPAATVDSQYEMGHVRKLQARHMKMQEKTFTKWINNVFQCGQASVASCAPQPTRAMPPALASAPRG
uniref:spectrin beta chain, non-erythrocytic 5-like n=1 Tax=Callithrix jacchus TaxID=9483 RepID=UPI00159F66A2|nr:spectrin beta chain, non-erythrocytic 5-like [Callithrix jacchus]